MVLLVSSFFSQIRRQAHCAWQIRSRTHSRAKIWAMSVRIVSVSVRSLRIVLFTQGGWQPASLLMHLRQLRCVSAQCVSYMHMNGLHSPLGTDLPFLGALGNRSFSLTVSFVINFFFHFMLGIKDSTLKEPTILGRMVLLTFPRQKCIHSHCLWEGLCVLSWPDNIHRSLWTEETLKKMTGPTPPFLSESGTGCVSSAEET